MSARVLRPWPAARAFFADERGGAAAEMGLMISVLTLPVLNVTDLAIYSYDMMQVGTAAHAGVQAAYASCKAATQWPSIANCTNVTSIMTQAAQSTTLGTKVGVATGAITEAYYCTATNGHFYQVSSKVTDATGGAPTGKPTQCSGATTAPTGVTWPIGIAWSRPAAAPGDYISITVSFTYTSMFPQASAVAKLAKTVTATDYIRLV